jgi:hypothetical protein
MIDFKSIIKMCLAQCSSPRQQPSQDGILNTTENFSSGMANGAIETYRYAEDRFADGKSTYTKPEDSLRISKSVHGPHRAS